MIEDLFMESGGKPVMYSGRLIQMVDKVPVVGTLKACLVFESVGSDWRQGVSLKVNGVISIVGASLSGSTYCSVE